MYERWFKVCWLVLGCWLVGCGPGPGRVTPASPIEPTRSEPALARPEPLEPSSWSGTANELGSFEPFTVPGELPYISVARDSEQRLPLEHTHVSAELNGAIAEVEVTQTYSNGHSEPIEAVYVFPLPENSAVNFMQMVIGDRKITAKIDERGRARRTYERAKRAGHTAALLEQERPNVFTQSVANIAPGEKIDVVVRYVQDLSYDRGQYEFVFPMVVGPRYMPGELTGQKRGTGMHPDTTRVVDASRVSPPYVGKGVRSGHDISIEVAAHAGRPIERYRVVTHEVVARKPADGSLKLTLAEKDSVPNRDFVMRYSVAEPTPLGTLYLDNPDGAGYFSLVVEPPLLNVEALVGRRELVFVVDVSGSMDGVPLAHCRRAMRAALGKMRPVDTFNIITFAGRSAKAFERPVPANRTNVGRALRIVDGLSAGGGTEMASAIDAALGDDVEPGRHRYVFFMTDGYVGNEAEIIEKSRRFVRGMQQRGQRARVFGFGVGSSPNRHLLGGLSVAGDGIAVYASTREDPERAVNQFYHYVDRAVLTNLRIDWAGLDVRDVSPRELPDLFASHPMILHGRYQGKPGAAMSVQGVAGERTLSIPVAVQVARTRGEPSQALGALWARAKVDDLSEALRTGERSRARERITELGLAHNLVTPFTSFVAVDESRRVGSGAPRRVLQPGERPEDVNLEAAGGRALPKQFVVSEAVQQQAAAPAPAEAAPPPPADAEKEQIDRVERQPSASLPDGIGRSELSADEEGGEGEASEDTAEDQEDTDQALVGDEALEEPTPQAESDVLLTGPLAGAPASSRPTEEDLEVESKRGCGCRLVGHESGVPALVLVLGALGVALWRRRRGGSMTPALDEPSPDQ